MAEYLSLEQIQNFADAVPFNQEFDAKLINVEDKMIKNQYPAIVATFEIQGGTHGGMTVQKTYWVEIRKSERNGSLYSRGLSGLKSDATTLGTVNKLPTQFEYPVNLKQIKTAYHKAFAGVKLRLLVEEQSYSTKYGETKNRKEVIILPGVSRAASSEPTQEEMVY